MRAHQSRRSRHARRGTQLRSTCPHIITGKKRPSACCTPRAVYKASQLAARNGTQCPQAGLCHLSQFCVDRARKPTTKNHGRSHQNKRDRSPQTARNFTCLFRLYSKTSNGQSELRNATALVNRTLYSMGSKNIFIIYLRIRLKRAVCCTT